MAATKNVVTIKTKLWILSSVLIVNMALIGGMGLWNSKRITGEMTEIGDVSLPATFHMAEADMFHDAIRGIVFRGMLFHYAKDPKVAKEIREEFEEAKKNIEEHLQAILKLEVNDEIRKQVGQALPRVMAYKDAAEKTLSLALAHQTAQAEQSVDSLQEQFEALEKELGGLSDLIQKDTDGQLDTAHKLSKSSAMLSSLFILLGIVIGLVLSFTIVRNLMKYLTQVIVVLRTESTQLNGSAETVSNVSREMSDSSTKQASAVQETAASLEEINSMVAKTAENSTHLSKIVEASHNSSSLGKTSVEAMLGAMDEISDSNKLLMGQVESGNQKIAEIVKVISEIGEKTKVINDIVFQTKLLSFNASVEAARAGEHGKGFAVVAEEVGNLAQMSGNAAREISTMLTEGIQKANQIVEDTKTQLGRSMSEGKKRVDTGVDLAKKCGGALDQISKQVTEVSDMTSQITTAIEEQKRGIQEITKAVHLFNESAQQSSQISQRSNQVASQLLGQANSMNSTMRELSAFVVGAAEVGESSNGLQLVSASSEVGSESHSADVKTESEAA